MKNLVFTTVTVLFFSVATVSNAQDSKSAEHKVSIGVSTHALVDIESENEDGNSIEFVLSAPTEAGLGLVVSEVKNNSLWLNYSSIVNKGKENSISVSLDGDLPSGISIELEVGSDQGKGKGKTGNAVQGKTKLEKNSKKVIDGMKSCFTGNGANNGHNITYTLDLDDKHYDKLEAESYPLTVTYTITEN